jgi:hypothetical protein
MSRYPGRRQPPTNTPTEVYTIQEFCDAHRISRAMYTKLKIKGLTPKEMHLGARIVIAKEAAAEWRKARSR